MNPSKYNNMYVWTIAFLLSLAAVASYNIGDIPANLIIAIAAASVLDLAVKRFHLKAKPSFPYSAFISGIIIGSIAPFSASPLVVVLAAVIAILSKYTIKLKGDHVFNPATLGLAAALAVFGIGDEWWAATGFTAFGATILLAPLLIVPNYKALKLRVALPFLIITAILFFASGDIGGYSLTAVANVFYALPYYLGFIMVSEPRTSPYQPKEQVAFGVLVALIHFAMQSFSFPYYHLVPLLAGNLIFSIYRSRQIT